MNKKVLFSITALALIAQSTFAAVLTVINSTPETLYVTVKYGAKGAHDSIKELGFYSNSRKATFNSGIHPFFEIRWRSKSSGIGHIIPIPSPRTMLDGIIEIRMNGEYIINFNKNGVYKYKALEYSIAPHRRGAPTFN